MKLSDDFYKNFEEKISQTRFLLKRPLTYTEKILYSHLVDTTQETNNYQIDFVGIHDSSGPMALLQLDSLDITKTKIHSALFCDHLIQAKYGAERDLQEALDTNGEIYNFLKQASEKFSMDFWEPGSGIIHQVILENYVFPGGMMVAADSHTQNAGGLGMLSIGIGGLEAAEVLAGLNFQLPKQKIMGIKLIGKLKGWASPKDLGLQLLTILSTKGAIGYIIEYFGEGVSSLSATAKATVCNIGTEMGATGSIFPFDSSMYDYLVSTHRDTIAELSNRFSSFLTADNEVLQNPDRFYDRVIEIDLSCLEPQINGPFFPDKGCAVSQLQRFIEETGAPEKISTAIIGSCTNSSYEDLNRVALLAQEALNNGLTLKCPLFIAPGSHEILKTLERDGQLKILKRIGAQLLASACGPCAGMWDRHDCKADESNTIITSFNRNYRQRNDGNKNTYAFLASPETVFLMALSGKLTFDFTKEHFLSSQGKSIMFKPPLNAERLPHNKYSKRESLFIFSEKKSSEENLVIPSDSEKLKKFVPFEIPTHIDFNNMMILIKVAGQCTTDHISPAGHWLNYRGHLENISKNFLQRGQNIFSNEVNKVKNQITGHFDTIYQTAYFYKEKKVPWIIIAEDNYGEGSSREHAAMEMRYLGGNVVLAKSFARIHEMNLKKQGVLPLIFSNPSDYQKIAEDDRISLNIKEIIPNKMINILLTHKNSEQEIIIAYHTMTNEQIKWFYAGSSLGMLRQKNNK